MASFGTRVTSITQDLIIPNETDNILTDNFMTYRYVSTGKKWRGETLKFPVLISKNGNGGSFSGLDTLSTGTVDTRVTLSYDVRAYSINVTIPGIERAANGASETQVINLVRAEMETARMSALDDLGTMFYGDGTGNASKDFNGLGNLDDDGTTSTNVGNLSRTTYPTLAGTRTASGGTLTLAKLAALTSAVSAGSAASQRPTLLVSSETEFDHYDSLLSPTVRANYDANGGMSVTRTSKAPIRSAELKGEAGYTALVYRGIPWVADEKAPTQTVWELNENYVDWYGLNDPELKDIPSGIKIEGAYSDQPAFTGFGWTGFMKPINQYGDVGHIILMGNLVTNQPRRHGRLTGVTGV